MPQQAHRRSLRRALTLISIMAMGVALAGWVQRSTGISRIAVYPAIHSIAEMMAVVVEVLVFASGWNAYSRTLPRHAVILGCAFLGVAMLDFSHAMSYPGMPEFVTGSSFQKAITFWLSARLLAAVALLWVSVLPARSMTSTRSRYVWLLAVVCLVGALHGLFLYFPQSVPVFFDPVTGQQPIKLWAEYLVMAINVTTAAVLWRSNVQSQQPFNAAALFGAVCAMALSECFFTLYGRANDFFNLMGHVYKVAAYLFLYRAIFVEVIEEPYRELAQVRDQLRATLDAVPDVMLELDLQGRYHAVHCARPEALLRPPEVLLGRTVHDVLPAPEADAVIRALSDALVHGTSIGVVLEVPLQPASRWFELSVARKGQAQGPRTRFIVLSRDITERKQIEAAMVEREAANHASRAKNEFLSRVSHELRTPLNAVIGFSQLLLHTATSPGLAAGQKQHVEYILRAGHHLLDMINDILDLTRIESGEAKLQIEPIKLSELVRDAVPLLQTQAETMGLTFQLDMAPDAPDMALGDRRCLKQVVINVLSNAVKYNRLGGTVTVSLRQVATGPGMLALVIADTGRGLSAEQQKGLFEPFNRLGADLTSIEGTGLGLVITRRLVEAMQGSIVLQSSEGVGTKVILTLRQASQIMAPMPLLVPTNDAMQSGDPAICPIATVLCVEDNPMNAALLRAIFDLRPSLRLLIAEDGRQARERFERCHPDLVLMDLNLPDMNGPDLLRALRQLPDGHAFTCIAMSADVLGDPITRAHEQGFADFWPKPLDIADVLGRLDAVLGTPRSDARPSQPGITGSTKVTS